MNLTGIFADISEQMRRDFSKAQKAFSHSGLKGNANEETLKAFLRQYLPRTIDISGGQLIDSDGGRSRQLDVMLSDAMNTPIFYESGEARIVPVECAYAVFEVKAFLDTKELEKAYENMKSAKLLQKKACFPRRGHVINSNLLYGREWEHWPIQHFLFAFDSIDIYTVKKKLDQLQSGDPIHQRIDSVCVLDKGVILNLQPASGGFTALPDPGSVTFAYPTTNALLLFYTIFSVILNQVQMPRFNVQPYIKDITF
jgi:hypothetical protein